MLICSLRHILVQALGKKQFSSPQGCNLKSHQGVYPAIIMSITTNTLLKILGLRPMMIGFDHDLENLPLDLGLKRPTYRELR